MKLQLRQDQKLSMHDIDCLTWNLTNARLYLEHLDSQPREGVEIIKTVDQWFQYLEEYPNNTRAEFILTIRMIYTGELAEQEILEQISTLLKELNEKRVALTKLLRTVRLI